MPVILMKQLLEAGVHFGHQTRRWNPKMKEYIFTERNGIYIIDLAKTVKKFEEAYMFVRELSENGGTLLFVGTKKQAADAIKEEAVRCGMYHVNVRWPGGMLTNYKTIKKSIARLNKLKKFEEDGTFDLLPKKEVLEHKKDISDLEKNYGGIKEMDGLPGAIFVVDPKKERNAVLEAKKLGITVVAVVDTNHNPEGVDYLIPGNDDSSRAVRLYARGVADSVLEGRSNALQEIVAAGSDEFVEVEEDAAASE